MTKYFTSRKLPAATVFIAGGGLTPFEECRPLGPIRRYLTTLPQPRRTLNNSRVSMTPIVDALGDGWTLQGLEQFTPATGGVILNSGFGGCQPVVLG